MWSFEKWVHRRIQSNGERVRAGERIQYTSTETNKHIVRLLRPEDVRTF
jgi:hypothetical protein